MNQEVTMNKVFALGLAGALALGAGMLAAPQEAKAQFGVSVGYGPGWGGPRWRRPYVAVGAPAYGYPYYGYPYYGGPYIRTGFVGAPYYYGPRFAPRRVVYGPRVVRRRWAY